MSDVNTQEPQTAAQEAGLSDQQANVSPEDQTANPQPTPVAPADTHENAFAEEVRTKVAEAQRALGDVVARFEDYVAKVSK